MGGGVHCSLEAPSATDCFFRPPVRDRPIPASCQNPMFIDHGSAKPLPLSTENDYMVNQSNHNPPKTQLDPLSKVTQKYQVKTCTDYRFRKTLLPQIIIMYAGNSSEFRWQEICKKPEAAVVKIGVYTMQYI